MLGKRGFYRHPAFVGAIVGLIIGIILTVLVVKGVIPINLGLCP